MEVPLRGCVSSTAAIPLPPLIETTTWRATAIKEPPPTVQVTSGDARTD
jgi:hypothetical protein